MSKQTHNAISMMSFGASCAVMLVSSQYALDSMGAMVVTILATWYCLIWLAVNSIGGE